MRLWCPFFGRIIPFKRRRNFIEKWFQCRYFQAFAAYAFCNVGLATIAGVLCAFIAPAAAGSGIPEVKAYLNGVDAYPILAPSTLFVKVRKPLQNAKAVIWMEST